MMNLFSAFSAFDYAVLAYFLLLVVFGYLKGFFSTLLTSLLLYLSLGAALLLAPKVVQSIPLPLGLCFIIIFILTWLLTRVINFLLQPMLIALPVHWMGRVGGMLLAIPRAAIVMTVALMLMELIVPDEPADWLENSITFPLVTPMADRLKIQILRQRNRIASTHDVDNWIE